MKKLFLLVALLLILAGGYFGYEYFLNGRSPMVVVGLAEMEVAEEAPIPINLEYYFVDVPSVHVSIIRNDQVTNVFSAQIILEVRSVEAKEYAETQMPKLVSAYIQYLHSLGSLEQVDDLAYQDFVKDRLRRISNDVLGRQLINSVLMQATFERKV